MKRWVEIILTNWRHRIFWELYHSHSHLLFSLVHGGGNSRWKNGNGTERASKINECLRKSLIYNKKMHVKEKLHARCQRREGGVKNYKLVVQCAYKN
jgi:hypothetical protein